MDETLLAHLDKLREIDRRLEDIMAGMGMCLGWMQLKCLRADLAVWIKAAEEAF